METYQFSRRGALLSVRNGKKAQLQRACCRMKSIGKLCEGELHEQFDEGEQGRPFGCLNRHWESAEPVLYSTQITSKIHYIDGTIISI